MNRTFMTFGAIILSGLVVLPGCSVGMAMVGKKEPELNVVRNGATRGEIELQLGSPVEIQEFDGKRFDIYEYEIGNNPSAGRAFGHGVMDFLTLGLWEFVGTPVEGVQGQKKRLGVTYTKDDTVAKIQVIPMPKKKKRLEESQEDM